jgi:hypothetical protein
MCAAIYTPLPRSYTKWNRKLAGRAEPLMTGNTVSQENSSRLRESGRKCNATEARAFSIELLREFSTRVFLHFGVSEQDAAQAADVLVCADLRGIDSHGVARLHTYFELLNEERINPRPHLKVIRSTPSTANIDGDNGLGLIIGPHANRIAMGAQSPCWAQIRSPSLFQEKRAADRD